MKRFQNRTEAGRVLANILTRYANHPDVVVLGLPRGGVPVAFEIAQALQVLLDIFLVRKLGTPGQEELAMGAIASGGVQVLNQDVIQGCNISEAALAQVAASEGQELERREHLYRGDRPAVDLRDRRVILVDDGLATGATMRAALLGVRQHQPKQVAIAVPVAADASFDLLSPDADAIFCVLTPDRFGSVGFWYEEFPQTSDQEVCDLLQRSALRSPLSLAGRSEESGVSASV